MCWLVEIEVEGRFLVSCQTKYDRTLGKVFAKSLESPMASDSFTVCSSMVLPSISEIFSSFLSCH